MTNSVRGDVEVELDEKKYIMRPTMQTLLKIEDEIGSIVKTYNHFSAQEFKIKEMATVIARGIEWQDGAPTQKQILDIIFEKGMTPFVVPVMIFLANALGGQENFIKVEETDPNA